MMYDYVEILLCYTTMIYYLLYYSAMLLFYYTIEKLRTFSFSFFVRTSFILSSTISDAI